MILDGRALASRIEADLAGKIAEFKAKFFEEICLVVVLVGSDEASEIYVRNKRAAAKRVGINSRVMKFASNNVRQGVLEQVIKELNADESVHGVLVQLPLPAHINRLNIISAISPDKDVDGFCASNLGALALGDESALAPCTAVGIIRLLEHYGVELCGANCCVVSESIIVGRPLALMLLNRGASVDVVHKHTTDLAAHTARADVLISATGVSGLISEQMIKPGAVLVDVGVAMHGARGDISEAAKAVASMYTPVPGGVGPMTVAMLLENTYKAAMRQLSARASDAGGLKNY